MFYEWDERKRESSLAKHGLDFMDAELVFEADVKVTLDVTRRMDDEARFADFAEVNDQVLKFVYTVRKSTVRCISMRVASRTERRCYHETKSKKIFQP